MVISTLVLAILVPLNAAPQTPTNPMDTPFENLHVAAMVQQGTSEKLILYFIQTRPTKFDTSPAALDALRGVGVSDTILRAMIAATASPPTGPGPAGAAAVIPAPTDLEPIRPGPVTLGQPSALLIRAEVTQALTPSHAHISQVKANLGNDFGSIAKTMAAQEVALMVGGKILASAALNFSTGVAGALVGPLAAASMLFHKAPTYTFVLALPGSKAQSKLVGSDLKIELRYGELPGVDPDAHEPMLLKLSPTKGNLRLVRAQKLKLKNGGFEAGKEKVLQAAVPVTVSKLGRGHAVLEATGLAPGEYGIILRNLTTTGEALLYSPIAKPKTASRMSSEPNQ